MKQNTAYGASRMTSPIRVIDTSNRPWMPRSRVSVASLRVSTRPMPSISAKNITARMVFSAAALTTLSGTMPSSMSSPCGWPPVLPTIAFARSAPCASIDCAVAGSTPPPGCNQLTSASPSTTAMPEATTV